MRVHGVRAVVLEAGDRVGGRAHTVRREGWALDLGCGWLHSGERNPWTAFARSASLTLDRAPARWDTQWRNLGFPPADQAAFGAAFAAFEAEVERLAAGQDVPLSDALPDDAWRGPIEAVVGYLDGATAAAVSLHDHYAFDAAASDNNWRVQEGLGTTIDRAATGLDIRLATPVDAITLTGTGVRVAGPAGSVEAARVIVTVSTAVLASDAIRFDPPIPEHRAAAAVLPLGAVGKLFLAVDRAEDLPINGHLRGRPYHARSASHRLRPFGWPIVECYFGGPYARISVAPATLRPPTR